MIGILSYNAGNTHSVKNALNRLGIDPIISNQPEVLQKADKIIFPGVGQAATAMEYLRRHKLDHFLKGYNRPILGICLGLQLMCTHSEEGDTECLGLFDIEVKKFKLEKIIPHMGWNNCQAMKGDLCSGITEDDHFYFVHSYYAELSENTSAIGNYGESFSAALSRDPYYAVQFHPEKSAQMGLQLIKNFIEL